MAQFFQLRTIDGQETAPLETHKLVGEDGSPFQVVDSPAFHVGGINSADYSLGRYKAFLAPSAVDFVTLGEGWTPLVENQIDGRRVHFKLEGGNPTGSFKDRGAALLVSFLRSQGIERVHDDSSGNAGAALAAYAARAGLHATLFAPDYASTTKLAQIQLYGAELRLVAGKRSAATEAARTHEGSTYASHAYHPMFIQANRSLAYELWEQLGNAPDAVIMPVGQGTQFIGMYEGFVELRKAGVIDALPRMIAVQAAACAPLAHDGIVREKDTLAEGIRVVRPVREKQIRQALAESGGEVITVDEDAIFLGLRELLAMGISCEPTCAVVLPAFRAIAARLPADATIVLSITGNGLKIPDPTLFLYKE